MKIHEGLNLHGIGENPVLAKMKTLAPQGILIYPAAKGPEFHKFLWKIRLFSGPSKQWFSIIFRSVLWQIFPKLWPIFGFFAEIPCND
jgi:hypothetical protein